MKTKFFIIVSLLVAIFSCKPENLLENENENPIQVLTVDDEDVYDRCVTAGVYGLLRLSQNSSFRGIVNVKVAEQFDGDDNALLSDINSVCTSNGINMADSFLSSITAHYSGPLLLSSYINEAINGFSYFDETEHVQIYIPFIDAVNVNSNPIICLNLNGDDTLPGYRIENGLLVTYNVTKEMAQENLVWVVSVNERGTGYSGSTNDSIPSNEIIVDEDTLFTLDTVYYKANTYPYMVVAITDIRICQEKEAWGNGRSDISWFGGVYDYSDLVERFDFKIERIKGSQINSWVSLGSNTSYFSEATQHKYEPSLENGAFMFYEEDVRRKFNRPFTPVYYGPLSGVNSKGITYKSKESPYGEVYLPSSYFYQTDVWKSKIVYLNGAQIKINWKYVP